MRERRRTPPNSAALAGVISLLLFASTLGACSGAKTKTSQNGRLGLRERELLDLRAKSERLRVLAQRYDNLWKRVNNRKASLFDERDSLIAVGRRVLETSARAIEGRSVTRRGLTIMLASLRFRYEPTAVRFDARIQLRQGIGPSAPAGFGHVRGYLAFAVEGEQLVAVLRSLDFAPDGVSKAFFDSMAWQISLRNVETWLPRLPLAVRVASTITTGDRKQSFRVELLDEQILVMDKKVLIPFRLLLP
ncbi:MAG: hypothetical protein KC609_21130 [Myxococcales bacterium]|nr:hypothetical protein [Myxococcales bacterium]